MQKNIINEFKINNLMSGKRTNRERCNFIIPDLPLPFIQDILVGREQIQAGQGTPYIWLS
jgi:hypothetical protein